ncbi:MAG: hypothetical protein MUC50_19605 [Myxococcota bacterium]|jgi:hypothetical protein|nr:hypothetical protein [Myxococcota bacterium]
MRLTRSHVAALLFASVPTYLLSGCSENAPNDAEETGSEDIGVPTDTVPSSSDSTSSDEGSDSTPLASDTDTGTGDGWDNPGCAAARNVVEDGLRLEVEVDLASYDAGLYSIREKITVTPQQAGVALSFYGERVKVLWASVGMAYDNHLATFCVGDFAAGDEVMVEVEYVVDEKNENALGLPFEIPMLQWGLRRYEASSGELMVGPFNEPYYAPFWIFVPQSMHRVNAVDDDSPFVESVELTVHVPTAEWTVVGPGGLGEQKDTSFHFRSDRPMPIYAFSFAASPDYEVFSVGKTESGVEVYGAMFPGSRAGADFVLPAALTTIDWMEENIGPFDFGKSMVFADVPQFGGGMEHVDVIWVGTENLTPDTQGQFLIVHEMMHHWWGNNVRFADWPHFWLAEGFDEWSTNFNVMGELMSPEQFAALQLEYRTSGAELTYPSQWLPIDAGPLRFADDDDMTVHFVTDLQLYYVYGAAFLEMVNQRLIRDFETDLNEALAAWFEHKRLQSATTEEFLAFLESFTLDIQQDYWKPLFDDWVYKTPVPTLSLSAFTYDGSSASVTVTKAKGGDQSLTGLEVVFVAGETLFGTTVELPAGTKSAVASVAMPVAPNRIAVDPQLFYVFKLIKAKDWTGPPIGFAIAPPQDEEPARSPNASPVPGPHFGMTTR